MPHFFFNIFDSHNILDDVGTQLPSWQDAQVLAIRHAGEVLQNDAERIKPGDDWRMEVTDEQGLIVFRLDFSVFASAALAGGSVVQEAGPPSDPAAV